MTDVTDQGRHGALHARVRLHLAGRDQRYTRNHRNLVEVLAEADNPLAVPEILSVQPELPQSSVYRSLAVLADADVVHRVLGAGDQLRFELTEELSGEHHHHLVCERCGLVADIATSPRLEQVLAEASRLAVLETGFEVSSHRLDLIGVCAECANG